VRLSDATTTRGCQYRQHSSLTAPGRGSLPWAFKEEQEFKGDGQSGSAGPAGRRIHYELRRPEDTVRGLQLALLKSGKGGGRVPKDVASSDMIDQVWVAPARVAFPVAMTRQASAGQHTKTEMVTST